MSLPQRSLWLLVLASLAGASPLDWVAGSHDLTDGAVSDPLDGLAVSTWSSRFVGPGNRLGYRYQNEAPLLFRRRRQHAGRLDTIDHQLDFETVAGGARVSIDRRQSRSLGELTAGGGDNAALWRQQDTSLRYLQQLTPRCRAGWGYDDERHDLDYLSSSGIVTSAAAQYHGGFRTHRLWSGVGLELGTTELGLGGAWRWQAGELASRFAGREVGAPLEADGYQLAAWVATPIADGWRLRVAGNWRTQQGGDLLRVGGKRYGHSHGDYEEWRAGLDLHGRINPQVTVTASLFQRSLWSDLTGNITAIPPPLGSLAGPRYSLASNTSWRQTGLATGVQWQAAPRTRFGFVARNSWGRVYTSYQVLERSGPTATPREVASSLWNQDLWLGVASLTLEQQVGTVTFGARGGVAVGLSHDRVPAPPGPPGPSGGDSFNLAPGVPFAFWCSTSW